MNVQRMWKPLLLAAILMLLPACGGKTHEPVAIHEETDKCDVCNMQIRDDGFASQLITEDGKAYKFDDIGCMHEWTVKNGTENVAIQFVRDYNTLEWVKLDDAWFAYDPSFQTPMAYGVLAFKDEASARRHVEEKGTGVVMDAAALAEHTWERSKHHGDASHEPSHGQSHGNESSHGHHSQADEHAANAHQEVQR